jgi:large subunit ribosomal protein L34
MANKNFGKKKGPVGRKRVHGFMLRMSTNAGRNVLKRRRLKHRARLSIA